MFTHINFRMINVVNNILQLSLLTFLLSKELSEVLNSGLSLLLTACGVLDQHFIFFRNSHCLLAR